MGVVRPLRSQSIYHGIADTMTPESDPALILCRSNKSFLSLGQDGDPSQDINADFCRDKDIPIIFRQLDGGAELVGPQQLLFQMVAPTGSFEELGVPAALEDWHEYFASPLVEAYNRLGLEAVFQPPGEIRVSGKKIGILACGQFPEAAVFAGNMVMEADFALLAKILDPPGAGLMDRIITSLEAHVTTLGLEQDVTPAEAVVATAVVEALEASWALAVYPSFPSPEELEAIEEFDGLLIEEASSPADDRPRPTLVSVPIGAGTTLLEARYTAGEASTQAVILMMDGRPENILLSGQLESLSEPALRALAANFNDAVPDTGWLFDRFMTIAGADAVEPAAPPGMGDPSASVASS